jgi:putative phosphoesterase
MELGIVSDTHDNLDVVQAAVDLFAGRVDAVCHGGDVSAPFAVAPFDADFDFYAVRGNNDGEWAVEAAVEDIGTFCGEFGALAFDGTDVALYHGTSLEIVDALVAAGSYDYVVHGHTHERVREERNGTVRLNPGGIATAPDGGGDPPAGIVLDTESGEIEFHDLR